MMPLLLGERGDLVEERDPRHEILHRPSPADPLSIADQRPALDLDDLRPSLFRRKRWNAPLAGRTGLADQFFFRQCAHDVTFLCDTFATSWFDVAARRFEVTDAWFDLAELLELGL